MRAKRLLSAATTVLAVASLGCATAARDKQLSSVARDWCMLIRASQVIPTYPLTEDLQPGDIFLVSTPVDEQHSQYKKNGFLPFDNHLWRLQPQGFEDFYEYSFRVGGFDRPLPEYWLDQASAWDCAPRASFPTYSFSVKRGGSFSIALPVQGVPVGLSLLGTDEAEGTVTLADAHTYGVDITSLHGQVVDWATGRRDFLRNYASFAEKRNYLRTIWRVYLTGSVNVSIHSTRSGGGGVTAGAGNTTDVPPGTSSGDTKSDTAQAYTDTLTKINSALSGTLTNGGTLKLAAASGRSVSLVEKFPRPLVIGYLGFDMEIGPNGVLGPPIPTRAVLENGERPAGAGADATNLMSNVVAPVVYHALVAQETKGDREAARFVADLDGLAKLVPSRYPCDVYAASTDSVFRLHLKGAPVTSIEARPFLLVPSYRGELIESINQINAALGNPAIKVDGFGARTQLVNQTLLAARSGNQGALDALNDALRPYRLLFIQAVEAVR